MGRTMEGLCSFMAATQRSRSSACLGISATPEKYTSWRPRFCMAVDGITLSKL